MKMEQCSETSAIKHDTPENNLKDYTQRLEHNKSLKSRIYNLYHHVNRNVVKK
jgi:hypothetical protein